MKYNRHFLKIIMLSAIALGFIGFVASCNEDFETRLIHEHLDDSTAVTYRSPKVLYLIIDGARGVTTRKVDPPNLAAMAQHSLFAWNSVSDVNGLQSTTWADMLTGVNKAKHAVNSSDFAGNQLADYPMFFHYLEQKRPDWRTAAFCASEKLSEELISSADVNQQFGGDDLAVQNAVIAELANTEATVVLGEFNGVDLAGQQHGYDTTSAQYTAAILQVDTYIGEIVDKLRERETFASENWLVIVASNKGGLGVVDSIENDHTIFSNPVMNNFIMFYNPRFEFTYIPKPDLANLAYEGYAVELTGKDENAIKATVPDDGGLYNLGSSGEYTVQIKVKLKDDGSVWPSFFGKRKTSMNTGDAGWVFMFHGDNTWRPLIGGSEGGTKSSLSDKGLTLDEWHTLTMKIYEEDGKRWLAGYTDGGKHSAVSDITDYDLDNDFPLTAGYIPGWTGTQSTLDITDIRIWNTALPDEVIASEYCQTTAPESHPYNNNLIGHWSCTEGVGNKFVDLSGHDNDFIIEGDYQWNGFSDLSGLLCPPLPPGLVETVPRGVDIPVFIFSWMGLVGTQSWQLDGKVWVPEYSNMNP